MNELIKQRRRKRTSMVFVPTASMGDIAFLLIIFFMLTSKFMKESHVVFKQPDSPDIDTVEDSPISVIVDQEGKTWLQGQPCDSPELLKEAIERLVGDKKDKMVMLKVDKGVNEAVFGPVLMNLGKAGVRVALIGNKVKTY